jgi:predicted nucleic acid-binding protein
MRRVFADTFYFLALLNATDQAHAKAVAFTSSYRGRLVQNIRSQQFGRLAAVRLHPTKVAAKRYDSRDELQ